MSLSARVDYLRQQVDEHEIKLNALRAELAELELKDTRNSESESAAARPAIDDAPWPLLAEEYTRYGRQMILPDVGLPGQLRLRAAKVLIIGVGGLGCPAAAYLAGAGIGTLGLVDGDVVELSNLHRQILHSSERVGMKKVDSAVLALKSLNPLLKYNAYADHLDSSTAMDIFPLYDLILDCTDAPQTRYMISDAAVLCGKPLISASALKSDGQLMVLNHPPTPDLDQRSKSLSGPCYRCVFPRPPPPESVVTCGEGGILGPVVGTMGVLMALQALQLLSSGSVGISIEESLPAPLTPIDLQTSSQHTMLILSASKNGLPTFRNIRLKGKRADCIACGVNATITAEYLRSRSLDYAVFCGAANPITLLVKEERIEARQLSVILEDVYHHSVQSQPGINGDSLSNGDSTSGPHQSSIIIDVRDEAQFSICSLPNSINIPWNILQSYPATHNETDTLSELVSLLKQRPDTEIYTICRLGNDSQLAVKKLQQLDIASHLHKVKDVSGGFMAWKRDVDRDWPAY